jgi:membrane associated rhomboid family serine protease
MIPLHDNNPTTRTPVVTIALIAICVLVYCWQVSLGPRAGQAAVYSFGFIPAVVFEGASLPAELVRVPAELTLVTSMFLHGSFMHLAGNMLYLWVFGNNIEDVCGHFRFVLFYLLCGLVAAFAQALPNPASEVPMIGASGAISGVLGAYFLLFPHASVLTLVIFGFFWRIVSIPALVVLGFWMVVQILNGLGSFGSGGGVAWFAHIGGFVAGMGLLFVFRPRRPARSPW